MGSDLFAGISVTDYAASAAWYERFLGAPPSFLAHETEGVWDVNEHGWVYVVERPEHAGHGTTTLFVDDLDAWVARIAEQGIEPVEREEYENGVRKAIYADPDGNEVGIGGGPV